MGLRYLNLLLTIACLLTQALFPATASTVEADTLEKIIIQGETAAGPGEETDIVDLRQSDSNDLGEALEAFGGLHLVRKGAIANDIVIRGYGRDNINLLIDGARIYGACPNRMDPAAFHVDIAEIGAVSVSKGPFDVRNAGGLGGSVNVQTADPEQGHHLRGEMMFGSNEEISATASASTTWDNGSAMTGYAYKYALPYKDARGNRITETYPEDAPNRYLPSQRDERAYRLSSYWGKFGISPAKRHQVRVSVARQEADDVIYPYLLMDAEYDDTTRVNSTYEIAVPDALIDFIRLQVFWNEIAHDMTDARRVSSQKSSQPFSMRTFAESETYGVKTGAECPMNGGRLSFGAEGYTRHWHTQTTLPAGTQDSIPDVKTTNTGGYLELMHPFTDNVSVTAGIRFDIWRTEAGIDRKALYSAYYTAVDISRDNAGISGNIQMHYQAAPALSLFAGFGRSVRPPDPVEALFALKRPMSMPNWVGNPGLCPPVNHEADIGIKYRTAGFEAKASFFYSSVDDYIAVVDLAGSEAAKPARSYTNTDATLYGGEASFRIQLPLYFNFSGSLAYTRGRNESFDGPLAEIPPLEARTAFRYDHRHWFAELEGEFNDNQDQAARRLNEAPTPGWGIAHIKAGASLKNVQITAGVQNIFDKYYIRHLSYQRDPFRSGIRVPESGRSIFFLISANL